MLRSCFYPKGYVAGCRFLTSDCETSTLCSTLQAFSSDPERLVVMTLRKNEAAVYTGKMDISSAFPFTFFHWLSCSLGYVAGQLVQMSRTELSCSVCMA
jgi:hypothetical protein